MARRFGINRLSQTNFARYAKRASKGLREYGRRTDAHRKTRIRMEGLWKAFVGSPTRALAG